MMGMYDEFTIDIEGVPDVGTWQTKSLQCALAHYYVTSKGEVNPPVKGMQDVHVYGRSKNGYEKMKLTIYRDRLLSIEEETND